MEDKRTSAKKRLIAQYKAVFSSPEGKAVLKDLARAGSLTFDTTPFVPGAPDVTAKNIGKQEFIKEIFFILKVNPDDFLREPQVEEGSHV